MQSYYSINNTFELKATSNKQRSYLVMHQQGHEVTDALCIMCLDGGHTSALII